MTRLRTNDIAHIAGSLAAYDKELIHKTGKTLRGVACHAAGVDEELMVEMLGRTQAAVVPVKAGDGLISGFSETVAAIVNHIGMKTSVTAETDVAGLAEVFGSDADVIFLSDDDDFIALNLKTRCVVDNAVATAAGFAGGLDLMTGGLRGKKILVIGCGPVGRAAAGDVVRRGGRVSIFDIDRQRCTDVADMLGKAFEIDINICDNLSDAFADNNAVIDATNSADVIGAAAMSPESFIAAPGMPLGLTGDALIKVSDRILHDPLQIGVATMAVESVKKQM